MSDTSKNKKTNNKNNKTSNVIIAAVLLLFIIITLFLFSNRTFLKNKYTNDSIELDVPMFSYFISDTNNRIIFKTVKKEYYLKEYFDEYLSNLDKFDYYNCEDGRTLYYDESSRFAIKKINIKKGLFLKTIIVDYEIINLEEICK